VETLEGFAQAHSQQRVVVACPLRKMRAVDARRQKIQLIEPDRIGDGQVVSDTAKFISRRKLRDSVRLPESSRIHHQRSSGSNEAKGAPAGIFESAGMDPDRSILARTTVLAHKLDEELIVGRFVKPAQQLPPLPVTYTSSGWQLEPHFSSNSTSNTSSSAPAFRLDRKLSLHREATRNLSRSAEPTSS
jgi:hypothetical protein